MILEHRLAPDHSAAQGHFPGNPIIPGAVLLAETLSLIEREWRVSLRGARVRLAKFPHPARPGERLRVEFSGTAGSQVKFRCAVDGKAVLIGELECSASGPSA